MTTAALPTRSETAQPAVGSPLEPTVMQHFAAMESNVNLYVLMGQRKERYEGEYGMEALAVASAAHRQRGVRPNVAGKRARCARSA